MCTGVDWVLAPGPYLGRGHPRPPPRSRASFFSFTVLQTLKIWAIHPPSHHCLDPRPLPLDKGYGPSWCYIEKDTGLKYWSYQGLELEINAI